MSNKELNDLENPENWDWENVETKLGTKSRRTIVSVAFPREDFKKVAECARQVGMNVSAFVRHAAVSTAEQVSKEARKSKWIPLEPGTYAIPSPIEPIQWQISRVGAEKTISSLEVTTNAKSPRVLELSST